MADLQSFVFHPSVVSTVRFKSRQLVGSRSDHNWSDIPDLEQAMLLHLIMKQSQYDPALGSEGTFASAVIDRWIAQYLRDCGRIKRGGFHRTTPFSQLGARDVSYSDLLSGRDGDRRRWRSTQSHTELSDLKDAMGVAMSILTESQSSLLEDVTKHSRSHAACQRGVSRRVIDREMESIRKIFIKCGINLKTACRCISNGIGTQ